MDNLTGWLTIVAIFSFGLPALKALDRAVDELKGIRLALYEINHRAKKREEGPDPYDDM